VPFAWILLAALAVPPPPPAAAQPGTAEQAAYDPVRIGPWTLRSDPDAFNWRWNQGVAELSVRSADGSAQWMVLDNGGVLRSHFRVGNCHLLGGFLTYPGSGDTRNLITGFAAAVSSGAHCPLGEHRADVLSWGESFPAALEAFRARAVAMFGQHSDRCIPPPPPEVKEGELMPPMPFHLPCENEPRPIGTNPNSW
jgi:hypothetical protein